eukprot:4985998-Prymnesium_polylepis.1
MTLRHVDVRLKRAARMIGDWLHRGLHGRRGARLGARLVLDDRTRRVRFGARDVRSTWMSARPTVSHGERQQNGRYSTPRDHSSAERA